MTWINAKNFDRNFIKIILPCFFISLACLTFGFYQVFTQVPDDYLQGELVKIMYLHVPFAWLSLALYVGLSLSGILYLIYLNPFYDAMAKSLAPLGLTFTALTLITGAIWGKPTWGTWWVWDARLTSMLILLFIYLSYVSLRELYKSHEQRAAYISAIFAVVGLVNIPIIKFSVNIWNTLHQPSSILRLGTPTIHTSMLYPLIIVAIGLFSYALLLSALLLKSEIFYRKIQRLEMRSKY